MLLAVVVSPTGRWCGPTRAAAARTRWPRANLGRRPGWWWPRALLVDYVMTVAVSVAAGVDNIISAVPALNPYRVAIDVGFVALLTAMNLRGVRESGRAFAVPTYLFIAGVLVDDRHRAGPDGVRHAPVAESAGSAGRTPSTVGLTGLALVLLALRAFSSGCTALTGVEAISNGVPAFRPPKSEQRRPHDGRDGRPRDRHVRRHHRAGADRRMCTSPRTPATWSASPATARPTPQRTVIAQIAAAVFGGTQLVMFFFIQAATALILILAANTAFNGFPLLGSILAQDRYLPRQLHTRGDRLAFSNGIILLAVIAGALIYAFDGSIDPADPALHPGRVHLVHALPGRHGAALEPGAARRTRPGRAGAGSTAPGSSTPSARCFTGAGPGRRDGHQVHPRRLPGRHRHAAAVRDDARHPPPLRPGRRRAATPSRAGMVLPTRIHAIVLVSRLHKPTLRALAYAQATRPDTLTALTVVDHAEEVQRAAGRVGRARHPGAADRARLAVPGHHPPGAGLRRRLRRDSPRDVVVVYIPEYVVGRWWEHLLHNQSALRLKARLLFQRGVMVTSVPWQLDSSRRRAADPPTTCGRRRGQTRLACRRMTDPPARSPGWPRARPGTAGAGRARRRHGRSGVADRGLVPAARRPLAGQRGAAVPGAGVAAAVIGGLWPGAGRGARLRPAGQLLLRPAVPHPHRGEPRPRHRPGGLRRWSRPPSAVAVDLAARQRAAAARSGDRGRRCWPASRRPGRRTAR